MIPRLGQLRRCRGALRRVAFSAGLSLVSVVAAEMLSVRPSDDLIARIDAATSGSVVTLAPGEYACDREIVVDRELSIVGAGGSATTIVSTAEGAAVLVEGPDAVLSMRGVTVRHVGNAPAHVVVVRDGELELERARLAGGIPWIGMPDGEADGGVALCDALSGGGHGLLLVGSSEARLADVIAYANGWSGVAATDRSLVTAEALQVVANSGFGMMLAGQASASIVAGRLAGNGLAGLVAREDSIVEIRDCDVAENWNEGILFLDRTSGRIEGARIAFHMDAGVFASSSSVDGVQVDDCDVRGNKVGIAYVGNAVGSIVGNHVG